MKIDPAVFEKMLPAEQVFEEMLPYLETLDAQIGGIIRLLKDKGITTSAEFAKYAQRGDDAAQCQKAWSASGGISIFLRGQEN